MFRESTAQSSIFEVNNYFPEALPEHDWCFTYRESVLPLIDEQKFRHLYCEADGRPNASLRNMASLLIFMGLEQRDYTHFITDVFEGEPNSPFRFHTKILGFEVIGTHLHGELNCSLTRIILTLDILKAYQRLKERKNPLYWFLTDGIRDVLDRKLIASSLSG